MNPKKFFGELKRRDVYRVAAAYVLAGWALAQGIAQVFPVFDVPNWIVRLIVVLIALGFPVALVLAWLFEVTPEGIKRTEDLDVAPPRKITSARKLDFVIIAILLLIIGEFSYEHFAVRRHSSQLEPRALPKSIAVLPFENLSRYPENASFADGVTDSLTTDLAQIHSLRVVSFQSVRQFKGDRRKSLPEIARALNVDAVVEGSVQQSADTVMINAQLVQARNDQHLWAGRYTRKTRDLLDAQSEIVRAIADAVKIELTPKEATKLATERPIDPEAQSHYFLGRFHFGQGTEGGFRAAISEYEQAIAREPNFAAAYAGIASCYSSLSSSVYMPPREAMPLAEKAARKAIELDPELAEAHAAIGFIDLFYHWDRAEGERELRKAIELNPNYSTAYLNYGLLLLTESRFDNALTQLRKAEQLEPTSALISSAIEWALFLEGKYNDVLQQAQHTLSVEPRMADSYSYMGLAYLYIGQKENAFAALKKAVEMDYNSGHVTNHV